MDIQVLVRALRNERSVDPAYLLAGQHGSLRERALPFKRAYVTYVSPERLVCHTSVAITAAVSVRRCNTSEFVAERVRVEEVWDAGFSFRIGEVTNLGASC